MNHPFRVVDIVPINKPDTHDDYGGYADDEEESTSESGTASDSDAESDDSAFGESEDESEDRQRDGSSGEREPDNEGSAHVDDKLGLKVSIKPHLGARIKPIAFQLLAYESESESESESPQPEFCIPPYHPVPMRGDLGARTIANTMSHPLDAGYIPNSFRIPTDIVSKRTKQSTHLTSAPAPKHDRIPYFHPLSVGTPEIAQRRAASSPHSISHSDTPELVQRRGPPHSASHGSSDTSDSDDQSSVYTPELDRVPYYLRAVNTSDPEVDMMTDTEVDIPDPVYVPYPLRVPSNDPQEELEIARRRTESSPHSASHSDTPELVQRRGPPYSSSSSDTSDDLSSVYTSASAELDRVPYYLRAVKTGDREVDIMTDAEVDPVTSSDDSNEPRIPLSNRFTSRKRLASTLLFTVRQPSSPFSLG